MNMSKPPGSGAMRIVGGGVKVVVNDMSGKVPSKVPAAPQGDPNDPKSKPGYKEGYADGLRDGQSRADAQIAGLKQSLAAASSGIPASIAAYFESFRSQVSSEVCDLSFAIAELIIRREFDSDSSHTRDAVLDALAPIINYQGVRVRVHPEFAELMKKGSESGVHAPVEAVADPRLGKGDVVVEGHQGIIDGTLESRLDCLREFLFKSLGPKMVGETVAGGE